MAPWRLALAAALLAGVTADHAAHHEPEKHHEKEKETPHHHEHKPAPLLSNATGDDSRRQSDEKLSSPQGAGARPNASLPAVGIVEQGGGSLLANATEVKDPDALEDFVQAFFGSYFVILATEMGDKTFFIAAILTMRHSRLLVWGGAMGALALMTVLSAMVGFAAPLLLDPSITHYAAVALFLLFGVKMLKESRAASSGASEELQEVEEELAAPPLAEAEGERLTDQVDDASAVETARLPAARPSGAPGGGAAAEGTGVVLQAFTLTFVAEWGDRSQIATIAMAADQDVVGVTLGGILGHACCTSLAVVGGKLLASRISEQAVLTIGGALFLFFALLEIWHGPGDR
ncbi:hypothetical protein AB1Y20_014002 [Prymnesium parvum]|uniref:GDT1 family protein n=1 Tax=Prymnesium parvum TaxID=97485 RepID=A0AB34IH42_PRYPA